MKTKFAVALLTLCSATSVLAAPEVGDVYAGASLGQVQVKESPLSVDLNTFTAFAGYQVAPNFAVEARLGVGAGDDSIGEVGADVDVSVNHQLQLLGKGNYDFNQVVSVYGLLGVAKTKYDMDFNFDGITGSESISETGLTYGAGLELALAHNLTARLEYQVLPSVEEEGSKSDARSMSVGLSYRF